MPPSTHSKAPRLPTINADILIDETTQAGLRRAAFLTERCSARTPRESDVGQSVAMLLHFGRTGTPWVIATDNNGGAFTTVCNAVIVEQEIALITDCVTPTPALAVVFAAARGRVLLAAGQALGATHIASLSGLSPQQVRLLARGGEFRLPMPARQARKWLRDRGVSFE